MIDGDATGSPEPACSAAVRSLADDVRPSLASVSVFDSSAVSFTTLGTEQAMSTGLFAELVRQGADLGLRVDADPGSIPQYYLDLDDSSTAALVITTSVPGQTAPGTLIATASCGSFGERSTIDVYEVAG